MITDKETNCVFISHLLEHKCPEFFRQLVRRFESHNIAFGIIPETKDIWVRDFMPLQVKHDYFVQYKYDPDYLKSAKHTGSKSDPYNICDQLGIVTNKVSIILDGGNVVKSKNKVILTTKIFKENPGYPECNLIAEIKNQLAVSQVIVIPEEPGDFVGHADGMVRFIDDSTVLVNQYPKSKTYEQFGYNFRSSLMNAGLKLVELPYTSWQNDDPNDATGCYINFLEVGKFVVYPNYAQFEDQVVETILQDIYKDRILVDIDCWDLAKLGGVLNCATWNILRNDDTNKQKP